MKMRWLVAMVGVGLLMLSSACRLGASSRLHEEPARLDVVYCEAEPITIVAPASGVAQASRAGDEEAR
jgi:hypothetical protein